MTTSTRSQTRLRKVGRILLTLIAILLICLLAAYAYSATLLNRVSNTAVTAFPNRFDGRYLLTVSDADMVGTAYADGVLNQIPGERDTLSVISLPLDLEQEAGAPTRVSKRELFASNSVTSWPQVLTVSPDGERAYIVETAGEIPDTMATWPDLQTSPPLGRYLTVVTLESGETERYDVMDYPNHIAVDGAERYIAIGSAAEGEQLGVLPVATLGDRSTYRFFSILRRDGSPASEITSVQWHPSGRFLAVGVDRSELLFYAVDLVEDGVLTLTQHGERLTLGNSISYGEFSNDGRFYLTTEINWAAIPGSLGFLFNPPGQMISVRFDEGEEGKHGEVSRVSVGQSPEGFAISPDERLIVTVDMRRTYLPDSLAFIPGTDLNSLSLISFDPNSGTLEWVNQYGFEGVLPEHAVFDTDGDTLAVVIYNDRENPTDPGYIEFWNVSNGASLERTGARIEVLRGPHTMAIVR